MSNPYLLLWFEATLQSWGHDSKFGRRDSLDFPTKSGVLGLICCARGAGDEQREWLSEWADLDMQVRAYGRGSEQPSRVLIRDFHMVGSGYDSSDPWQKGLIPKTIEGKKAVGGGSKITHRYYLQDMAFGVVIEAPEQLAKEVQEALIQPLRDIYLGRKCCVPTEFIFQGEYSSVELGFQRADEIAQRKERAAIFHVRNGAHEGEIFSLNDVPVQFGTQKQYRDRRVTLERL